MTSPTPISTPTNPTQSVTGQAAAAPTTPTLADMLFPRLGKRKHPVSHIYGIPVEVVLARPKNSGERREVRTCRRLSLEAAKANMAIAMAADPEEEEWDSEEDDITILV
ncbi:hypothetical protein CcaverHIS641_0210170 [Cutaneotrichosporon cavernicola]|nr:hypothetical protein CcaverHIS641_0210170 [Cutaneotrichosporon cavernicola]